MEKLPPQELSKKLEPAIKALVQKVGSLGLMMSALIFDPDGEFVIRCGNAPHEGLDLIRLHYYLAKMCVQMEESGDYSGVEFSAPDGKDPESAADKLALALLAMPPSLLPDRIVEMAQQYAELRRPNG